MFGQLFNVVRGVLLPVGGQDPVSTVAWFGLLAATITVPIGFLKALTSGRGSGGAAASTPAPQMVVKVIQAGDKPKRRRRRSELGFFHRFLISIGVVKLSLDQFSELSRSDRQRYAGDKRYDPRFFSRHATDDDLRGFERDRSRRVRANLSGGEAPALDGSPVPQRRKTSALPAFMEQAPVVQSSDPAPEPVDDPDNSERSFDDFLAGITGRNVPVIAYKEELEE